MSLLASLVTVRVKIIFCNQQSRTSTYLVFKDSNIDYRDKNLKINL